MVSAQVRALVVQARKWAREEEGQARAQVKEELPEEHKLEEVLGSSFFSGIVETCREQEDDMQDDGGGQAPLEV